MTTFPDIIRRRVQGNEIRFFSFISIIIFTRKKSLSLPQSGWSVTALMTIRQRFGMLLCGGVPALTSALTSSCVLVLKVNLTMVQ